MPSPTSPIASDAKHSEDGSDDHAVQSESASSSAALATAATGASPVVVKTEPNGAEEESEASRTGAARGTRTSSRYTNWAERAQQIKVEEAEALAQAEAEETTRFAARQQKEANRSARAQTVATANTNTMAGVHRNHRDLMLAPGAMEMLNMLAGVGGGSAGAAGGGAAVAAAAAAAAAGGSARTPWLGGLAGSEVGVGSAYMRAYDGLVAAQNGSISGGAGSGGGGGGGGGGGVKRERNGGWLGLEGEDDAEEEDVKPKKRVRSRKKGAGAGAKRKKGAAAKRGSATEEHSGARKCGRCGKPNHTSRTCGSKTHADGRTLKTINCRRCERPTHAHLGPCDFKTDIHGRKVTAPPIKAVSKAKKAGKGRGRKQAAVDEGEF